MNNKHLIKEIRKILSDLMMEGEYRSDSFDESKVIKRFEEEMLALILSEKKDLLNKFSEIVGESKPKTYIVDGKKYYHSFGGKMALDQYEKELRAKLSQLTEEEKK